MADIKEVKAGREKWPMGIDIQTADIKDMNDYITYKTIEYTYYDFQDKEL
jgi:hypothetical protein